MPDGPVGGLGPDHGLHGFMQAFLRERGLIGEEEDRAALQSSISFRPSPEELERLMFVYFDAGGDTTHAAMMRNEPDRLVARLLIDPETRVVTGDPVNLLVAGWVHGSLSLERRFELQQQFAEENPAIQIEAREVDTLATLLCTGWLSATSYPESTRVACAAEVLAKLPTGGAYGDVRSATLKALEPVPGYELVRRELEG